MKKTIPVRPKKEKCKHNWCHPSDRYEESHCDKCGMWWHEVQPECKPKLPEKIRLKFVNLFGDMDKCGYSDKQLADKINEIIDFLSNEKTN